MSYRVHFYSYLGLSRVASINSWDSWLLMMVRNLDKNNIHQLITADFEGAWNSVAANPAQIGRDNLMFARQAMTLLEFGSRLCHNNASALTEFSNALNAIESKYFTRLPSVCAMPDAEFTLPYIGSKTGNMLLWALFDQTRHGLAHQYQQIIANLTDGRKFFMELFGANESRFLRNIENSRTAEHLAYYVDTDGDVGLKVDPAVLCLDFNSAILNSNLLTSGTLTYLTRPRKPGSQFYAFDANALRKSLQTGNHAEVTC
jgi:hypothetical protein